MGITGLIPFLEKASRRANVGEFSGCTVAIDSYCWLHKGAFACADKLVRGEHTDIHIKYCLKYVRMLLSKNIKPILVFDGRHLPAKAMTESKRRESRDISKKRAAELLSLGKIEEARSYMRRSVDITHAMALGLIQECRKRNVDCIVAPYEADSQLAYLNIKNIAHLVITEDSDLILFGCTKVLFKMDLDGTGTLVETIKLPLVMRCPIEHYSFDKFRQMCIMSGCDYLPSLPGIGLAKARQFITATQDPNIANALKKLPSYFNRMSLAVTDEYRENFLKAEATFRHQYVYDPLDRRMVRLTDPDDDDVETALCVNAGELLEPKTAFQLALGNVDPFTLKVMDDWHPDDRPEQNENVKTESWKDQGVTKHSSIWSKEFRDHLSDPCPWQKKAKRVEPIIAVPQTRSRPKVVNLVARYVPETQDERAGSYLAQRLSIAILRGNAASVLGSMPQNGDLDNVLSIETLSNMYSLEPVSKKPKTNCNSGDETYSPASQHNHNIALTDAEVVNHLPTSQDKSPILENKERSYKKCMKNGTNSLLKRMSKFPRTTLDENVVKSKFFNSTTDDDLKSDLKESDVITIEESPEKKSRNPFRVKSVVDINKELQLKYSQRDKNILEIDSQCSEIPDSQFGSQKENSPMKRRSPVFESNLKKNPRLNLENGYDNSEESVIENTYPLENLITPVDSQLSFGSSPPKPWGRQSQPLLSQGSQGSQPTVRKTTCRVPGLKRNSSLPSNQPTLLSKFGFQKKPVLKR